MEYQRPVSVSGSWVKAADVKSGVRAKLMSETVRTESQFKNEDGTTKLQDVAKIRFEDKDEVMNIAVNRATLAGLIEAFGTESKGWIGKTLMTQTEKMVVGGRRVTALYLLPDGFELGEDAGGYMIVKPVGGQAEDVQVKPEIEYPDEINPADIPF